MTRFLILNVKQYIKLLIIDKSITFNSNEYDYITVKRLNKKRDHNHDLRKSKSVLESASIVQNKIEKMETLNVATHTYKLYYLSKPLSEAEIQKQDIINPFKASEVVVKELKQLIEIIEKISNSFRSSLEKMANHKVSQKNTVILNNALFDFKPFYQYSNPRNSDNDCHCYCNSCTQSFMEKIISTPATEACCERFFRITSQQTRRSYVTNIRPKTIGLLAYLQYYNDIIMSILDNKDIRETLHQHSINQKEVKKV